MKRFKYELFIHTPIMNRFRQYATIGALLAMPLVVGCIGQNGKSTQEQTKEFVNAKEFANEFSKSYYADEFVNEFNKILSIYSGSSDIELKGEYDKNDGAYDFRFLIKGKFDNGTSYDINWKRANKWSAFSNKYLFWNELKTAFFINNKDTLKYDPFQIQINDVHYRISDDKFSELKEIVDSKVNKIFKKIADEDCRISKMIQTAPIKRKYDKIEKALSNL